LLDGKATISRESQQAITRSALLDALKSVRHVVAAPPTWRSSGLRSANLLVCFAPAARRAEAAQL
jgi:hypothetical protein